MRVAVVDDDPEDLANVIDYLTRYIQKNHAELTHNLKIKSWQKSVDFIKTFNAEKYDLIILDIYLKEVNGIQLARFICMKDRDCHIIFVTSSIEFVLDGYGVFASGYFIKPINEHEEEFAKMFEYIYPKFLENNQSIQVPVLKSVNVNIPYDNIYFADINHNHKLRIVTKNQDFITSMSFEECQSRLLSDKRFLECHYRIIVNMDYIQSMKTEDFILVNGDKIPISHRKRQETKLKDMNYLANKD